MRKRIIRVQLSENSINAAIKELKDYKIWLVKKTKEFLKALASEGVQVASLKFSQAIYDGTNDVRCQIQDKGDNKIAVVAIGNATLFIEFGTGVKYPDNHPEASSKGMLRGDYGHKLGKMEKGWRYTGDPGSNGEVVTEGKHAGEVHTYGNPANMSMYMTIKDLQEKFEEIARRVYK